jgi:hypothetical protein
MTSLRSVLNQFTPELQIRYRNAFEVLVKFGIFTGKSSTSTNKKNLGIPVVENYATQSSIRAIYVWNMLVSSSEIPNNTRVYFYAVHDLQEHSMDDLAQHTGLSSYVSDEQMSLFPTPSHF